MEYRNREDGSVLTYSELMHYNPSVFIPPLPTAEYLDGVGPGYDIVRETVPNPGKYADALRDGIEFQDGAWYQAWQIIPWDDDRIAAAEAAVRDATSAAEHARMAAYLDDVREMRERILNRLAGIATMALATGDQVTVTSFLAARQSLLDITKIPGALAAKSLAELESAIKPEYARIVKSVGPVLKTAFDKVDQ